MRRLVLAAARARSRLLYKIARVTAADQREASIDEALLLFKRLENEGKLSPSQKAWRDQLLALRTSVPH
jgi:hypothetical protein